MNPLSKIIVQKKAALEAATPISQDSYDRWLDNECTKRFVADLEVGILEAHLDMNEENAAAFNLIIDVMTDLTMWKPQELEANE